MNIRASKVVLLVIALFLPFSGFALDVDMADGLRENGKIYVVVAVVGIVFIGIVAYLVYLDKKLKKLEESQKEEE